MLPASGSTCADGRWSNGSGQTAAVKRKQSNVVVGGNLHVDERGELWREQRLHLAPRGSERRQVRGAEGATRTRRVPHPVLIGHAASLSVPTVFPEEWGMRCFREGKRDMK